MLHKNNAPRFLYIISLLLVIALCLTNAAPLSARERDVSESRPRASLIRTIFDSAQRLMQRALSRGSALGVADDERFYDNTNDFDPSLWEGGVAPYPDAPACDDHSNTTFHTLWNKEKGCHYDHTHGYDPDRTIFKDVVAQWDQEISYPWQTNNENLNKHKGYIYLYTEAKNGCELGRYEKTAQGCIRKILYQLHSIGTNMEVTTRFHSFRFAAEVCDLNKTHCGIVQGGGHTDYGVTHCPYKNGSCPKPTDPKPLASDNGVLPELVSMVQPPYVANGIMADEQRIRRSGRNTQFWNGFAPNAIVAKYYPDKPNSLFGTAWSSVDGWTLLEPSEGYPYKEHFLCQDGSCSFNHSEFRVYSLKITLPENAAANTRTYTSLFGQSDASCQSASSTCAPLDISASVPTQARSFYLDRQVNPDYAPELEFDICFNSASGKPEACNASTAKTSGWSLPQDTSAMQMGSMTH